MPEKRLEKARGTLPEGYQFGDAGGRLSEPAKILMRAIFRGIERDLERNGPQMREWRRPSANAAERLARRGACGCTGATFDPIIRAYRCRCGLTRITLAAVQQFRGAAGLRDRIEDFTDLDEVADRGHLVSNDPPLERVADPPDETEEQAHWNTIEADYWGV